MATHTSTERDTRDASLAAVVHPPVAAARDDGLVGGRPPQVERRHHDQRQKDERAHDHRRNQRVVVVAAGAVGVRVAADDVVAGARRQSHFCKKVKDKYISECHSWIDKCTFILRVKLVMEV